MMMTKIRKSYTREFKLEALHLADTSGKPKAQVERELGLSQGLLFHWRRELARQGLEAFPGHGRLSASDEHLRQLERENSILRQERDILKKAIAVLTPKPQ
jgi:transposase